MLDFYSEFKDYATKHMGVRISLKKKIGIMFF